MQRPSRLAMIFRSTEEFPRGEHIVINIVRLAVAALSNPTQQVFGAPDFSVLGLVTRRHDKSAARTTSAF